MHPGKFEEPSWQVRQDKQTSSNTICMCCNCWTEVTCHWSEKPFRGAWSSFVLDQVLKHPDSPSIAHVINPTKSVWLIYWYCMHRQASVLWARSISFNVKKNKTVEVNTCPVCLSIYRRLYSLLASLLAFAGDSLRSNRATTRSKMRWRLGCYFGCLPVWRDGASTRKAGSAYMINI